MQVKALKTFLNSQTHQIVHAGEELDVDDSYAGDLEKREIVAPAGSTTSASAKGAVPQPQKTAAMGAAPGFIGSKSLGGGAAPASSSSQAGQVSQPKTVVTPPPPGKR